jgi:hypothetical protein
MADNKNGILKRIVGKIATVASAPVANLGRSLINYATEGDYLGMGNDSPETISAPTGNNRTPSQLELTLAMAQENSPSLPLKKWADEAGTRLYQRGHSKDVRNQYMNNFYTNNLSLTEQGKKDFTETNTVSNPDVLDYARNTPDGAALYSQGLNWGGSKDGDIRKNINISPAARDKREVLLHELTHYVDSKHAISTQKDFLNDLSVATKKNQALSDYIELRTMDYGLPEGAMIAPTEIYSMVSEFLGRAKTGALGPAGFPKNLVKYFPHIEIPKGLLTN